MDANVVKLCVLITYPTCWRLAQLTQLYYLINKLLKITYKNILQLWF